MEISSVWFAGSTNLYSREFYELVQRRLRPNGVFQQWIQLHHIGATELVSVVTTLRAVFPRVSLWVYGGQGILVATNGEQRIQPAALARIAAARDALGWPAGELPSRTQALLASRLLAPDDVTRLASASRAPLNTDRNRFLEYAAPRYNLVRDNLHRANVLLLLRFATFPPFSLAAGNVDDELARAVASVGRAEALRSLGSIEPIGGAPRAP